MIVLLFTKIPGLVPCKTRLGSLSEVMAPALLADTVSGLKRLKLEVHSYTLPLYDLGFRSRQQTGDNFSERIEHAFSDCFCSTDTGFISLIGSDAPFHALEALQNETFDKDVILGPTTDGGLYLIGLSRKAKSLLPPIGDVLFAKANSQAESFSTEAKRNGLSCKILAEGRDIDRVEDLEAALSANQLCEKSKSAATKK